MMLHEFYILWGEERKRQRRHPGNPDGGFGEDIASSIRSDMIIESKQGRGGGADPEPLDLQGKRIVWESESGERKKLDSDWALLLLN